MHVVSKARQDFMLKLVSEAAQQHVVLGQKLRELQGHMRFPPPPRYLLYRVLEPLGPYIVGTWEVGVYQLPIGVLLHGILLGAPRIPATRPGLS